LRGANLTEADLVSAYLAKTDLTRANLTKATFLRAEMSTTNLTGANLCETIMSDGTIMY
jgi:uncharacterized protein YjbI with pentapeptide repeats